MMNRKHLRPIFGLILAVLLGAGALQAKNRKAEQLYKQGQKAELKNDWDGAVDLYQKAVDADPSDASYEIAMRRARFQCGQKHVDTGVKLRSENKLAEAMGEFQKGLIADPASEVALQEIKRTQQMMLDQQKPGSNASSSAGLTETQKMEKEEDERVASLEAPPELKPTVPVLKPMKMNSATPTMLFRTVAAEAGLYVSFDPQGLASNKAMDVNLDGMTVEQALDYLAFVTHTFWKPISSNTIFVADDNTQKRRDYQTEAVRVFYLPNAYTVQEFQEIANALRTVAEIRRVFTYNALRALVVRGTPDEIAFVEKLVHDLDKPKAEVIVDVMILETNSSYSRQLAATIASGGTAGLNVPIAFTPRASIATGTAGSTSTTTSTSNNSTPLPTGNTGTTPSGSTSVGLNSLSHISSADFSTSLPGALINAMLTDNRTKVLNRPQVRASDGQKVELQVGLRIPYATGSLGSAVGATTVGVSPLVQTQFSYADTGVTLIIQPTVHSADELSMHVEITVASVQQYENLGGGISQPVIAQEKNITDVRMRNGEVSLLGGLNQNTDSNDLSGIPGLTNIPVLGKFLFGSTSVQRMSDQLLIAITPHIVRTPQYTPDDLRTVFAGSDQNIHMIHEQLPDAEPVILHPTPAPAAPAKPAPDPAKPVASVSPSPAVNAAAVNAPAAPVAGPPGPSAPAADGARLSFLPGPVQVAQNGSFKLTVQMEGASDVHSLSPLHIKYNPAEVHLTDADAGDMLLGTGVTVNKTQDIHNDTGEATVTLARLPGEKGVSGSGAVATLSFSAVGKGTGAVSITAASLKNSQAQAVPAELASVPVTVE